MELAANQEAHAFAAIDLLLTVAYIDGLNAKEEAFIRSYIDRLVEHLGTTPETAKAWRARLDAAYARLDAEIAELAAEVVSAGDDRYVQTRLKVRAVALFRAFSPADQASALQLLDVVAQADGTISPQELALRDELLAYFQAPPASAAAVRGAPRVEPLAIAAPQALPLAVFSHPWLDPLEQVYSTDPDVLHRQAGGDYNLIFDAIATWERQRARGNGRLLGVSDVSQLPPGARLLDNHVHVMRSDRPTELVVLGDLHGCYSCLKAALLQSGFIDRARAHQQDPTNQPDIKLVLLGDYIDRGLYSLTGVLRAALQLQVALPDHVILLRGNHESLHRNGSKIVSTVNPAEAIPAIADRVSIELLEAYRHLFEHMPTSLVFDGILFVHGGIPRDDTLADRYRDLASLEDPVIRFEMMWGDPVGTDFVPLELQRASPRFTFGREQFRAFMQRVGCHTMIRGHEQTNAGFVTTFDLGEHRLHTLFSAGGDDNADLPANSRYRAVTPMALTIRAGAGPLQAIPWPIQYQPFNRAANNGLYRLARAATAPPR